MIARVLQLCSKRNVSYALVVPILTRYFPSRLILAYKSLLEPNPVNLNMQRYRNAEVSSRRRNRNVLDKTYWHQRRDFNSHNMEPKNSRLSVHPGQRMLVAQQILKESSLIVSIVKIRESLKQPLTFRNPAMRSSKPSATASPFLSTTTPGTGKMQCQSKWKIRLFWRIFRGQLMHCILKLGYSRLKRKASNEWQTKSLLDALCLQNWAPGVPDTYSERFLTSCRP